MDRDEERLQKIETHTNRLADLVELLAMERHTKSGHTKPFPNRHGAPLDQCEDGVCVMAFELANTERA